MDRKELKRRELSLSWYLEFIQSDLDRLDDRDIAWPLHLLSLLPAGLGEWPAIAYQYRGRFGDIKNRQERLTPTYMKIGDRTLATKEFLNAKAVQRRLSKFLSEIMNEKIDTFELMPKAKIILQKERTTHVETGAEEAIDTISMPRSFCLRPVPIGKEDPVLSVAVLNFASLLNGLPVDSIKKCKRCQKYFANLSERKKIFCTIECAWKYHARAARDKRKKDPRKYRAYLKKQREIMQKKYDEVKVEKRKRREKVLEEIRKPKKTAPTKP